MDENEIISRLAEIFAPTAHGIGDLQVGIGDDAAVFTPAAPYMSATTDLVTEGIHFNRRWSDLRSIGRKVTVANLADIYAMGMRPKYLLVAAALPRDAGNGIFELAEGIAQEAKKVNVMVIGGDLSLSEKLTVSITALGEGPNSVRRSGARVGDSLFLCQLPGHSLIGLTQLQRNVEMDEKSIEYHRAPTPHFEDFLTASQFATAMIDISDGIATDARHLAEASGVKINIESELLRRHPDFSGIERVASQLQLDPIETILRSGEEHSPLFTAAEADLERLQKSDFRAQRIGTISAGTPDLTLDEISMEIRGFDHFA